MVRYLFYTIGDLTYQSPLVITRLIFFNIIFMFVFYFFYSMFLYCFVYCVSLWIHMSLYYFCTSLLTTATGWIQLQ